MISLHDTTITAVESIPVRLKRRKLHYARRPAKLGEISARCRSMPRRIYQAPDAGMSRSDTPLFVAMRRAVLKAHPSAVVTPMLVPFGTDSAFLQQRGVIAYGFTPMVLDQATAATMHSDRERIPLAEFFKGIHIYYDVLASNF